MAKPKNIYICQSCGFQSYKWMGKCPDCSNWNCFVEEPMQGEKSSKISPRTKPLLLSSIPDYSSKERIFSGIQEIDRVLGGGIFPASVVLLAGEPGIGKSTLMLQTLIQLQKKGLKTLYVSGEESLQQIKSRASRLKAKSQSLWVLAETDIREIQYHIEEIKPDIVVIDSIQVVYNAEFAGAPGNVGQVRECAARLFKQAKETPFTLFLIGHVTKEGTLAGPKTLEHLVDVVVYFEGNTQQHRIIRSIKNRFGASNELGVFEMRNEGLLEVTNVSGLFLNLHQHSRVGSSIVCSYEGTRPLLVEVQTLVTRSDYGTPQRTVSGFDHRRLSLILAILEKFCGQHFAAHDVFVKVAGGLRIDDPGIDLGVAAALYSSLQEYPLDADTVYIGELGLSGEVRPVSFIEKRLQESQKMGFKQVYIAKQNLPGKDRQKSNSILLSPVLTINELLLPVTPTNRHH